MNISSLKTLVANLPTEISAEQFSLIEQDVEELLAQQRALDEAELTAIEQKAAKLREKLGVQVAQPPAVRPPAKTQPLPPRDRPGNLTDWDVGIGDEVADQSAAGFQAELAAIRDRNLRRRREH